MCRDCIPGTYVPGYNPPPLRGYCRVAFLLMFWSLSGVYLWARRPKKRLLGGICLVGGMALFTALVVLMIV